MTQEEMNLMREWVKAQIDAAIADHEPGSDGYFGTGYAENEEADRLFDELCEKIVPNAALTGAPETKEK